MMPAARAAAAARDAGIVDGEAAALRPVKEVDRRAVQVQAIFFRVTTATP